MSANTWVQRERAATSCVDACCDLLPIAKQMPRLEFASAMWNCQQFSQGEVHTSVRLHSVNLFIYSDASVKVIYFFNRLVLVCIYSFISHLERSSSLFCHDCAALVFFSFLFLFSHDCSVYISPLTSSKPSKQGCAHCTKPDPSLSQSSLRLGEFHFKGDSLKHHTDNKVLGFGFLLSRQVKILCLWSYTFIHTKNTSPGQKTSTFIQNVVQNKGLLPLTQTTDLHIAVKIEPRLVLS